MMGVNGRMQLILSYYETSSAEHGPFCYDARQTALASCLDTLPILLDDAKYGRLQESSLERLKKPLLYLLRTLALEWFTASLMKGRAWLVSDGTFILQF